MKYRNLGLNFIDTALAYGNGRSERLVGQVVRERPERIFVATKVERNLAVSDGRGMPDGWREKLRAHRWVRDPYR